MSDLVSHGTINLYTAAWLLPVSGPPIADGALAVSGEKILAVGPRRELLASLPTCQQHDLGIAAILPGLVNVHSHLELTVMRNYLEQRSFRDWIITLTRARNQLNREDLRASAIWGACEAVRAGITTLADTGDSGLPLDGLLALGLRGIVFQEVFGPDPAQADGSINELKEKVAKLIARTNDRVHIGISPHTVFSVSARLFRAAADYAGDARLPIAIHTAESKAEVALIRNGSGEFAEALHRRNIPWQPADCSVIEYLERSGALEPSPLLIHAVQLESDDLQLIKRNSCAIAHCPKSNAKFGHGRAPLESIIDAGIKVGLGSDSVASNNICDLIDEARTGLFIHQSAIGAQDYFTPAAMIAMMTLGGAQALGLESEIGTLTPGKQADFIALDLTAAPIVPLHNIEAAILYCASGRDVCLTVVAGRELYRDDKIKVIDEQTIHQQIIQVAEKLTMIT